MKACFLFPGQGAQYVGMGKDLFDADPEVRSVFEAASDLAGFNLPKAVFEGDEDNLKRTSVAQVALAAVEHSLVLALRKRGVEPSAVAGFSLGEWPAMVAAGSLSMETMLSLVAARGRLMDEAGSASGGSGMAAVMGLWPDEVGNALAEAGIGEAWVANRNSPTQTVIAGTEAGLSLAESALKAAGAKRVIRLKVSGAFHSPVMSTAYEAFKILLDGVAFDDPTVAFFSNVTGGPVRYGFDMKRLAASQIVSPVRWIDEESAMVAAGVRSCIEVGPGTVLAGLMKGAHPEVECRACGTLENLDALVEALSADERAA
ncbi:MAG: ACP S-malonyltransferase [Spirochaetales bacterium]|nr:ACP S-malonyltransferase [Spirochaetales bacterium]